MLCGGFVAVMYWRVGNLNTSTSHHLNLTSHHLNLTSHHFNLFMFYSNAPMRNISTSFSVRKRQSPRRRFFLVSPANCTRSSLTTR